MECVNLFWFRLQKCMTYSKQFTHMGNVAETTKYAFNTTCPAYTGLFGISFVHIFSLFTGLRRWESNVRRAWRSLSWLRTGGSNLLNITLRRERTAPSGQTFSLHISGIYRSNPLLWNIEIIHVLFTNL